MAKTTKTTSNENLEERGVKALESIGKSIGEINDWIYDLDADMWQERLEWYLNEFYQIAKSKTVGTSNRPTRESERNQENKETQGEESKS
jgi:hypothetical protein|tara:strand:- start:122 stop:391 length:270 start_codon:yes stop_codon:yes gene_type:complete